MNRVLPALLLILPLLLCTACGDLLDAASDIASRLETADAATPAVTVEATPTAQPTPEPVEDNVKFNAYISASGVLTDRMELCITGYVNRVCALDGAYDVDKASFKGWINSIGDSELKRLNTSLEYASQAPAMEPVDGKYLALAPSAIEVCETLSAIYAYYDTKGYVDDDFVKGEALHDALSASIDTYYVLAQDFITALSEMSHERAVQSLEVFKENGQMLLYHSNVFMLEAGELCTYLSTAEVSSKGAMELDAAEYRAIYDRLAATHTEFSAIATQEQADAEGITVLFSSYKRSVDDFKSDAATIAQALDGNKKVDYDDVEDLIEGYGDMIDNYNRMIR